MSRAFIAVHVPATPTLTRVLDELAAIGGAVKPTKPENLHVTLRFLGPIDDAEASAIGELLLAVAAGVNPFTAQLQGVGAFPNQRRPSVVWAAVQGADPLTGAVEELNLQLELMGLGPPDKHWQPHLTLARVKARPPAELVEFFECYEDAPLGTFPIMSIDLMRSDLTSAGPRYTRLARAGLG